MSDHLDAKHHFIKVSAIVMSGPKHRNFDLFIENGLMLILRCHIILSKFHLNWFHENTKVLSKNFGTLHDDNIFQTNDVLKTLESINEAVLDCAIFLPRHFTSFGTKVLLSSLNLVLPFNHGQVSAKYLSRFLDRVLSQQFDLPSLSIQDEKLATEYALEEEWSEPRSTEVLSSLPPSHPLSWDQAFMLLQYLGVTSTDRKSVV